MLRFDQFSSEEEAYAQLLLEAVKGYEHELMAIFLQEGPEVLKRKLRLQQDRYWNILFDYLVFERNLLKVCVVQFMDFFTQLVRDKGPLAMRTVLGIENKMYDKVYEQLFDLVALFHGALLDFVKANKEQFLQQIKIGKGSSLRENLGLSKEKYANLWKEIVTSLCEDFGQHLIDERITEQGLASFDLLMNSLRRQRGLQ